VQTIDDEALVLDSHRYGDRHLILSLLTRGSGAQRAVLRRARGGKAPLASAAQVLSRVHVSLAQRPHAELADCRHLDLIMSSFPLAAELTASAAAAVVAELLATFCPAGEPDERAYRLGVSCLEALLGKVAPDLVVAYSQYWMLNLGGVLPEADAITAAVGAAGADYLSGFRRRPVADIGATPPSRTAQWLDRRVREEAERPLRALAFLRQLSE
jgi:DNA repair protein RecO